MFLAQMAKSHEDWQIRQAGYHLVAGLRTLLLSFINMIFPGIYSKSGIAREFPLG